MPGKRGRQVLVVLVAVAVCLTFSGCFLFSSFKWTSIKVKAGKSTEAVVGMVPEDGGPLDDRDYPFIMIGLADTTQLALAGQAKRTWDVKGRFGGPDPLGAYGDLETAVLASDNCNINGIDVNQITDVEWTALRPDSQVNDRDKTGIVAQSRIRFKAAPGALDRQEQVYVFSGGWSDEGTANGVAEPEEVGCSGGTISALTIVP